MTYTAVQNRWILVEFIPCTAPSGTRPSGGLGASDVETSSKQIWAALKQSVITHFGDTGWGAVGASLTGACPVPSFRKAILRLTVVLLA